MSFTAMFLMARKCIESWVYWIVVDVIGIVLYFVKDVKFLSVLYILLLIMAIKGLVEWQKDLRKAKETARVSVRVRPEVGQEEVASPHRWT
jgi:nicotinamide mononucleotide transporter